MLKPISPADATAHGMIWRRYSLAEIAREAQNRRPALLMVGRRCGRKYNTKVLMQNRQVWWNAVTKSGKRKLRPLPNIHLLYTEMDMEKKYHPET